MTNNKTIWHEPTEVPQNEKELVIKTERCGYESYKLSYNEDTGRYVPWSWVQKDVIKWCYLNDLLELPNKIERLGKELEIYKQERSLLYPLIHYGMGNDNIRDAMEIQEETRKKIRIIEDNNAE